MTKIVVYYDDSQQMLQLTPLLNIFLEKSTDVPESSRENYKSTWIMMVHFTKAAKKSTRRE